MKTNILKGSLGDVSRESFVSPINRAMESAASPFNSMLHSQPFVMIGVITVVYPPTHPNNKSKTQYEYLVKAAGKQKSYTPVHCVLNDRFGGNNDYEQFTLKPNQRVLVECIVGDPREGVIMGGLKNRLAKDNTDLGHHWIRRFNKITESITKDNEHYIRHDDGNEIRIAPGYVSIKNSDNDEIKIDKQSQKITITDGSGQTITIDRASGQIMMSGKKMEVKVSGDVNITASGSANIKAKTIKLNGSAAGVVTGGPSGSHPVDFVTGIPIKAVSSVKAG